MPRASSTSSRYGWSRSISVEVPTSSGPALADPPGNEHAAGVAFVPLDDQLIAAEIRAAEPGQIVLAAHVDVFESAGRNAIAIVNDKSHQAHGGANLGDRSDMSEKQMRRLRTVPVGTGTEWSPIAANL